MPKIYIPKTEPVPGLEVSFPGDCLSIYWPAGGKGRVGTMPLTRAERRAKIFQASSTLTRWDWWGTTILDPDAWRAFGAMFDPPARKPRSAPVKRRAPSSESLKPGPEPYGNDWPSRQPVSGLEIARMNGKLTILAGPNGYRVGTYGISRAQYRETLARAPYVLGGWDWSEPVTDIEAHAALDSLFTKS